jgi:hypothetical protein
MMVSEVVQRCVVRIAARRLRGKLLEARRSDNNRPMNVSDSREKTPSTMGHGTSACESSTVWIEFKRVSHALSGREAERSFG